MTQRRKFLFLSILASLRLCVLALRKFTTFSAEAGLSWAQPDDEARRCPVK
jgi:hypothetical protein